MTNRSRLLAAAAVSALALCAPGLRAQTTASSGYTDEIKALRQRLDQLEAQQKEAEQKRKEAEAKLDEKITSEKLSTDALRHDQFITAEGFTAGYDQNRFVIQSGDGNFVFRPWLHFQFRAIANDRNNFQGNKSNPEDETNVGFEVRRMRFGVDGNMFSPDLDYFFNWATNRTSSNATVSGATPSTAGGSVTVSNNLGGVPILEEAWVRYHLPSTPFFVRAGQIKDPVLHEQITSSRYQQSAERSLTADIFNNGDSFTEAVTFIYDPSRGDADALPLRIESGINHGMRSANTNFESYPNNGSFNAFNYGIVGRAEYKIMGRWKDYAQVGAVDTKDPLLVIGAGADYSERGHDSQVVSAIDGMYADPSGLSIYASFEDRYTSHNFGFYTQSATGASISDPKNPAFEGKSTNEYSVLLQAGYLINQHIEPFGRYEYIKLQGTAVGAKDYIQCITAGVNYYFYGHRLKLTGEVMWLPQGMPFDDTPNDILANPSGQSEIVGEIQIQLLL